jgi:hypothetical protein
MIPADQDLTNPIATSTAFRLPIALLQTVDRWCAEHDITRSQFFRHCITDRIKSLGLDTSVSQPQQQQAWEPELYDRLRRKG